MSATGLSIVLGSGRTLTPSRIVRIRSRTATASSSLASLQNWSCTFFSSPAACSRRFLRSASAFFTISATSSSYCLKTSLAAAGRSPPGLAFVPSRSARIRSRTATASSSLASLQNRSCTFFSSAVVLSRRSWISPSIFFSILAVSSSMCLTTSLAAAGTSGSPAGAGTPYNPTARSIPTRIVFMTASLEQVIL